MAKGIQYTKTTQMINVNENFKKNDKTNDKNSSITESLSMYDNTIRHDVMIMKPTAGSLVFKIKFPTKCIPDILKIKRMTHAVL